MSNTRSRGTSKKNSQQRKPSSSSTSSSSRLLHSPPPTSTKQVTPRNSVSQAVDEQVVRQGFTSIHSNSISRTPSLAESLGITNNAQQDTQSLPDVVEASKFSNLDATSAITSVDLVEKSVILSFTKYNVFPKLKFLIRLSEDPVMRWSTDPESLCQYVLQGCNINFDTKTPLEHKEQQWYSIRKVVADKITNLRNDKSSAIRIAFYEYLDDRHKEEKGPKALSKFQELREDKKVHTEFIKRFVKPVVGVAEFNNRIKDSRRSPDSLFTRTDEAFALLTLENNWDRWVDIFKLNGNRIPAVKRQRDGEEKVSISKIRPKYTEGGINYSDASSASDNTKGRGWSEMGRIRFNKIVEMVNKSRQDHPNFLKDFVVKERQIMNQNRQRNTKRIDRIKNHVLPAHDKFCDDFYHCCDNGDADVDDAPIDEDHEDDEQEKDNDDESRNSSDAD